MDRVTFLVGTAVTMTGRGVLKDQAIAVEAGRIVAIESRAAAQLTGRIVDWRGLTVVPGLADCHAHVDQRQDMLLNLAHGVTLLRNMWGNPWHLLWQREVAAGRELGPHLVTTSPVADGRGASGTTVWPLSAVIDNAEAAHEAVSRWAAMGYQQVKAYSWLTAETLKALGEACSENQLPMVGHCPQSLTVQEAVDLGQSCFEHLMNYEYGVLRPEARARLDGLVAAGAQRFSPEVAEARSEIDEARLTDLASRLAAEAVTSCPTLIQIDRMFGERNTSDPRLKYVDPVLAEFWRPENDFRLNAFAPADRLPARRLSHERTRRIAAALRDAGAAVLVGTDAPNPFVFHGSSVVEEMEALMTAGYSAADVLYMATRGAADFLQLPERGRVDVGCVADLLAVRGDPTHSPSPLRDPVAVVVAGSVLERPDLNRLLDEAVALIHHEVEPQLSPVTEEEQHVGDYDRTDYGHRDGATRVSCCSQGTGLTRWREQVVRRGSAESRTVVIDSGGRLVSALVERSRDGGTESATVSSAADRASYDVRVVAIDGSESTGEFEWPLLPAADLCAPALLDAVRAADDNQLRALSLASAFGTGLLPEPAVLVRGDDGVLQTTHDAVRTIAGDSELDSYSIVGPMERLEHRRTGASRERP